MKQKLFTLLLAVAASVGTMFAWDYEYVQIGDLYYNLDATNQMAIVAGNNSASGEIIIPASVTYNSVSYSVISIGYEAFSSCSSLTSVTIPNSVTSIGEGAFYNCTGLTSVTIGNSVTGIEYQAFYNCTGLTSVTIPNSVTSIGSYAFSGCSGLTGDMIIPNSVTSIGVAAFYDCSSLTSIEIPNSVTSIGDGTFYGCSSLTSLKLSAVIEPAEGEYKLIAGLYHQGSRDAYHQQGYEWLKNLIFIEAPAWFFDVPETDWIYCPRHLQHVTVNNGELTESALNAINQSYKTLQTLDVSGATNTEFADEAFKGYYNLTELKLPADLQKVSYMMVAGSINLQSIDIPASVEEIDQRAFEDCRSIKSINFGGNPSLIRIGNWAFYNCHELQNLEIPEGVTEIGDGAFYGCTYLKNLNLPASVQSIGDNGFAFCSKLQKMVVHAVTPPDIDYKTFEEVSRQTPVYVPDESVDEYENHPLWKEFFIQGISNMPQGLEDVQGNNVQCTKIVHNGQIFILRGEHIFDTQGKMVK